MYNASTQFHNAVFENSPVERVLFRFADGTIFTNEDINISAGLKVIEAANLEEELTIGACTAASLDVTVMNYHGLLSGFAFGEAEVSLGVRTETSSFAPVDANTVAILRYGDSNAITFTGHDTVPYLRVDGEASSAQPPFAVKSILIVGTKVHCIGVDGSVWCANWVDGYTWNELEPTTWSSQESKAWDELQGRLVVSAYVVPNNFMAAKLVGWAATNRGMASDDGILYEYAVSGTAEKFEYVKLGTFLLNTPTKRKVNLISVSALDRMSRFDVAADNFWNGLTYPITIGEIFTHLCAFVGVPKATTSFINSTRSFSEAPMAAEGITAREILKWIAEAACSFARMTRDGEVELAWFGTRTVSIPMTQYFSITPAEYEVAPIDKMQISGSKTDIGVIIGEGNNGYQILDNPLLYGASDAVIRPLGVPIYNRLAAYAAFSPVVATAVCDWSIQAGDIIEIILNGVTYKLPVYSQTITWKGNARVSYESTGAECRPVMDAVNRRVFSQKRAIHEVNETVNGLTRRIEDTEGNVANLELFAGSLTLSIANGSTSSTLKLMAGSTELSSANITLTGMVTFANLTDGVTQISGGNIKTGLIAAARIDVDNLYVKHLSGADGTFSGNLSATTTNFNNLYAPMGGQVNIGGLAISYGNISSAGSLLISSSSYDPIILRSNYHNIEIYAGEDVKIPTLKSSSGANVVFGTSNGNLAYSGSSRRYKHDIQEADTSMYREIIERFSVKTFVMNNDEFNEVQLGAIAEEVNEFCDLLVGYRYAENGTKIPDFLKYDRIPLIIIPVLRDALAEIGLLKRTVEALEEKIGGESIG